MIMTEDDNASYGLVMPFWIDTEGYTDRDRNMFTCGVEFQMIYDAIRSGRGWNQCIHNENTSRVRMMCGKLGVTYAMSQWDDTWTNLSIKPRPAME